MNGELQRDKTSYNGWDYQRQIEWWIGENTKIDGRIDEKVSRVLMTGWQWGKLERRGKLCWLLGYRH